MNKLLNSPMTQTQARNQAMDRVFSMTLGGIMGNCISRSIAVSNDRNKMEHDLVDAITKELMTGDVQLSIKLLKQPNDSVR